MNEKGISLVQLRQRKTRQTAALFLAPVIILLVVSRIRLLIHLLQADTSGMVFPQTRRW